MPAPLARRRRSATFGREPRPNKIGQPTRSIAVEASDRERARTKSRRQPRPGTASLCRPSNSPSARSVESADAASALRSVRGVNLVPGSQPFHLLAMNETRVPRRGSGNREDRSPGRRHHAVSRPAAPANLTLRVGRELRLTVLDLHSAQFGGEPARRGILQCPVSSRRSTTPMLSERLD